MDVYKEEEWIEEEIYLVLYVLTPLSGELHKGPEIQVGSLASIHIKPNILKVMVLQFRQQPEGRRADRRRNLDK